MSSGEVNVPKDLAKIKPKLFFNLTKRQIICFGSGALIGVPLYLFLKDRIIPSLATVVMILTMMPFFLFAMYEKNGQPLEKLLSHFYQARFVRPKHRPYQTDNLYASMQQEIDAKKEVKEIVQGAKARRTETQKKKGKRPKLTREEKKRIAEVSAKARNDRKLPHSAQETIEYKRMCADGVCQVTDTFYSKTIQFQDINYQLAQNEDKSSIFESWCDFLNYFDSSIHMQLSCLNLTINRDAFESAIEIPKQGDEFDEIREEYAQMLRAQLAKGNNGLVKTKYITFGIEADSLKNAKSRLERIENDLLNNFKRMGVPASSLDGAQRLEVMHSMFHMNNQTAFQFDWKWLPASGLSTKDFIAPSSFDFSGSKRFTMGDKFATVSCVQILAAKMKDRLLADLLDMESNLVLSLHIQPIDQASAIKDIKRKMSDVDRMKIEEQMRAVRSGYDMDIIPSDLKTFGGSIQDLLENLQNRDERMFLLTFLVMNASGSKKQLDLDMKQARGIAQQYNCEIVSLDFQQEQGMVSCLPLGLNRIQIQRALTTSSTAIFVPFTTQELFQTVGQPLYYGINALSNNLIMADRRYLKNPNGMILGIPGSGKSFAAKREISNCFLLTLDDIAICDPESEYGPLVRMLHGQIIRISPTSKDYINPLDIDLSVGDNESQIRMKSDFVLSLMEIIAGQYGMLEPIEKGYIDKALRRLYFRYAKDPRPENMPILSDLYDELIAQNNPRSSDLAAALEIYVNGSLSVFNHRTNVDTQNRLVCFDIKELGQQLKLMGMLIVQDQVWARVTRNRALGKTTRYYIDEFHLLLNDKKTAAYSIEIWKRFRKWSGIPTGITQNAKDFLDIPGVENILENSDFIYMLSQGPEDRRILSERLGISKDQLSFVLNSPEGEGLMFFGDVILPFRDKFPKDTKLYQLMTTKPNEVHHQEEINEKA